MSNFRTVIDDYIATLPEADRDEARAIISLEATAEMNMVGGRPSDCARSAVAAHRNGTLTAESFAAARRNSPAYPNYR